LHEWETKNNPQGEWNLDSWNNHQGREIAKEIKQEYGNNRSDGVEVKSYCRSAPKK